MYHACIHICDLWASNRVTGQAPSAEPTVSVSRIMGLSRLSGGHQLNFLGLILQGVKKLVFA